MIKELDYQTKAVDELVEKCEKLLQSGGERKKLTALLDGVAKMKLGDFKDKHDRRVLRRLRIPDEDVRLDHGTRSVGQGEVEVGSAADVVLFQLLRSSGHAQRQPHGTDLVERFVGRHAGKVNLAADGEVAFHRCSGRYKNNADGDK